MLFAFFKHHQSEFTLRGNDKINSCAQSWCLRIYHHLIARLGSILLPLTSKRYQHYKEPMFLHLLYSKS